MLEITTRLYLYECAIDASGEDIKAELIKAYRARAAWLEGIAVVRDHRSLVTAAGQSVAIISGRAS